MSRKEVKLKRLNDAKYELEKCLIILKRAEDSINEYIDFISNLPLGKYNNAQGKQISAKLKRLKQISEIDIHTLSVLSYMSMKYVDRVPELKNSISIELRNGVEVMRHHYEHWDTMEHFYISINNEEPRIPNEKHKSAKKYYDTFRGTSKNSPKGSLAIDWDTSKDPHIKHIRVGGALDLEDLRIATRSLLEQISKMTKEY